MCGIVGIYYFDPEQKVQSSDLHRMNQQILHRGPDDEGSHIAGNVGIAMRRLSIIDLAGGHQPMFSKDRQTSIVFNGEVYNFRDLRPDLEKRGYDFESNADTEVVLRAYEAYGVDFLAKLNGMYGLAIWDANRSALLIARDRIGIKPLYYYRDDEKILFGSEIKSLLSFPGVKPELDKAALSAYLRYGSTPAPHTLFRNIYKLPPAHYMLINGREVQIRKYWQLSYQQKLQGSEADLTEQLYELLKSAIDYQMVADVPLGAFLSGGIDSSSIVHIMRDLGSEHTNTYSIGFGAGYDQYNELTAAGRFARDYGTNHHEILVRPDTAELFPKLIAALDEPLADSSFIMTYLVSQLARESVTVILSGVGGDELFGGYRRYLNVALDRYIRHIPLVLRRQVIQRVLAALPSDRNNALLNYVRLAKAYFSSSELSPARQYANYTSIFSDASLLLEREASPAEPPDYHQLYFDECDSDEILDKLMYFDLKTSLPEQLLMLSDKMSMAVSLEARVPYLDHRVVEFAARLPERFKIKGFKLRHLQKQTFRGRFPDYVFEQKKKGFGAPIGSWMRNELKEMVMDLLGKEHIARQGIFDAKTVGGYLDDHFSMKQDHTDHLLALLSFQIWHQAYLGA